MPRDRIDSMDPPWGLPNVEPGEGFASRALWTPRAFRPLKPESLRQKHSHLAPGHRSVQAVERRRDAASAGDPRCGQGFDELEEDVTRGHVVERRLGGRRAHLALPLHAHLVEAQRGSRVPELDTDVVRAGFVVDRLGSRTDQSADGAGRPGRTAAVEQRGLLRARPGRRQARLVEEKRQVQGGVVVSPPRTPVSLDPLGASICMSAKNSAPLEWMASPAQTSHS